MLAHAIDIQSVTDGISRRVAISKNTEISHLSIM